jgi:hypothetical protein
MLSELVVLAASYHGCIYIDPGFHHLHLTPMWAIPARRRVLLPRNTLVPLRERLGYCPASGHRSALRLMVSPLPSLGLSWAVKMNTGLPGKSASFDTTHWSVVLEACGGEADVAKTAFAKLCESYWYPLYAYARRRGRKREDAEDLSSFLKPLTHNPDFL